MGSSSEVNTVIFEPPSTTWQFVTTTPSERTMNPVPTPWPCWAPPNWSGWKMSVVTFTTAGSTRWTTAVTGSLPASRVGSEPALTAGAADDDESPSLTAQAEVAIATSSAGTSSFFMENSLSGRSHP